MSSLHQYPFCRISLARFQKKSADEMTPWTYFGKKKIQQLSFWHLKLFCWVVQFISVQIQRAADEVWQAFIHTPELIVCNKLVLHCTWILRNCWQSSAIPQSPESSTNSNVCLSWCKTLAIPTCVHFPADRATLSILQHFDFTLAITEGMNRAKGQSQQWETQNNTRLFVVHLSRDGPQQQDEPSGSNSRNTTTPTAPSSAFRVCACERKGEVKGPEKYKKI